MDSRTEFFKSFPVSIKGFFLNHYDSVDSGKNYLIPIYQRRFVWEPRLVLKLVRDIKDVSETRSFNSSSPYFIGGIVLCKELSLKEPPYLSLEVIDGQQRLTTISIILASVYYQLKYHEERNFEDKAVWVEQQINTIEGLLFLTKEIPGSFTVETGLTIERSDELNKVYSDILISFKNGTYKQDFSDLLATKRYPEVSHIYCKKIIIASQVIENALTGYDNVELLEFCSQLLDFTYLVVTKTVDIDTGFLVFEKLNDSGASLEPEDLLKSYLFSEATPNEYKSLSDKWKKLINLIEEISPTSAKLSAREFLDHYLTIKGLEQGDMDKNKIFKVFKEYFKTNSMQANDLVDDLYKIAKKYKELKRDTIVKKYLNAMNFRLGYLILLTYYSELDEEDFSAKKYYILKFVIRIEFAYLLSGNSKKVRLVVTEICNEIVKKLKVNESEVEVLIEEKIQIMKSKFITYLQTSNIYTKKKASKILLEALDFHFGDYQNKISTKVTLLMQEKWNPNCTYGFDEDSHSLYVYRLGNLTLAPNELKIDKNQCFLEIINILSKNSPTFLTQKINNKETHKWGKEAIDSFSELLAKKASEIFIEGKFNEDVLKL